LARLCLDHNVSRDLGVLLDRDGHDVVTVRDISGDRLPDDALLLMTVRLDRIFVTHNRDDSRMLHDAWVTWPAAFGMALPLHPGIHDEDAVPYQTLADLISRFLDETPPERLANAIFWWHRRDRWDRSINGDPWEPYPPSSESGQE